MCGIRFNRISNCCNGYYNYCCSNVIGYNNCTLRARYVNGCYDNCADDIVVCNRVRRLRDCGCDYDCDCD